MCVKIHFLYCHVNCFANLKECARKVLAPRYKNNKKKEHSNNMLATTVV